MKKQTKTSMQSTPGEYISLLDDIAQLLEESRRQAARSVNAILTATYWEIGRRIVEFEQHGKVRAGYGQALLKQLSMDLSRRFRRGFSERNLQHMRMFYLEWPIPQTLSAKSHPKNKLSKSSQKPQTLSAEFDIRNLVGLFPLPWSTYVRLMSMKNSEARAFYEFEALHGGWSVRQLDRQISSQYYERTLLSHNKAAMLRKGAVPKPEDAVTPEDEIRDPYILEFLGLKDEYSESDFEEALIHHLERFLLELGADFCFISRQKRLRIGNEWYRVDLVFYHRRLRCLVLIDLKVGKFT
ncbi:MAG: YhcG family protein, partial [bacterium]